MCFWYSGQVAAPRPSAATRATMPAMRIAPLPNAAGVRREDRYAAAELGLTWRMARGWWLRPQLSRTHNRSNLPLVEYGRTEASVSLRRVWQ